MSDDEKMCGGAVMDEAKLSEYIASLAAEYHCGRPVIFPDDRFPIFCDGDTIEAAQIALAEDFRVLWAEFVQENPSRLADSGLRLRDALIACFSAET